MYSSTPTRCDASSHTELVTGPAVEPVLLADASLHLRITPGQTDEDSLVTALVSAARELCETATRRAFVTQTWDLFLDGFPGTAQLWYVLRNLQRGRPPLTGREQTIEVPRPPLQSVVSVTYADQNGNPQTLDPSLYRVSAGTPGRLTPAYGLTWPTARNETDSVRVRFTAGYGDNTQCPVSLAPAIKLLVGHWYDNRSTVEVGIGMTVAELPVAVKALLSSLQWGSYG